MFQLLSISNKFPFLDLEWTSKICLWDQREKGRKQISEHRVLCRKVCREKS